MCGGLTKCVAALPQFPKENKIQGFRVGVDPGSSVTTPNCSSPDFSVGCVVGFVLLAWMFFLPE